MALLKSAMDADDVDAPPEPNALLRSLDHWLSEGRAKTLAFGTAEKGAELRDDGTVVLDMAVLAPLCRLAWTPLKSVTREGVSPENAALVMRLSFVVLAINASNYTALNRRKAASVWTLRDAADMRRELSLIEFIQSKVGLRRRLVMAF